MQRSRQGFTMAELLSVVAVVAVLVAIAVPIFTSQLEKSREATDTSNIRSQYAEVMADVITTGKDVNTDGTAKVTLKQTQDDWQNSALSVSLSNLGTLEGAPSRGGSAWVEYKQEDSGVTIHFEGGSGEGTTGGDATGGGGGSTPQAAHENNDKTANSIGNTIVSLLNNRNSDPSTKVTITVGADGSVGVDVSGKRANVSESDILRALGLSGGGKVNFDSNDTVYVNGYKITIHKNNGHDGGKVIVEPING